MRKELGLFLLIVLTLGFVSGVEFSPSSLTFVQELGEELCQVIEVADDNYTGEILIVDNWEENKSAEELGLFVSYLDTIVDFEDSVGFEVCIDGEISGEFSGELVFILENGEEQVGSELVVVIENAVEEVVAVVPSDDSSSGGGNAGITTIGIKESDEETARELLKFEAIKDEIVEDAPTITGNAVDEGSAIGFVNFLPFVFIVFIVGASVFLNARKKRLARLDVVSAVSS